MTEGCTLEEVGFAAVGALAEGSQLGHCATRWGITDYLAGGFEARSCHTEHRLRATP